MEFIAHLKILKSFTASIIKKKVEEAVMINLVTTIISHQICFQSSKATVFKKKSSYKNTLLLLQEIQMGWEKKKQIWKQRYPSRNEKVQFTRGNFPNQIPLPLSLWGTRFIKTALEETAGTYEPVVSPSSIVGQERKIWNCCSIGATLKAPHQEAGRWEGHTDIRQAL